jgi:hypothetical protein
VTQPDRDTDPDALAESNIPADLLEPKLFTSSTGYKIQWVSAQFIRSLNQTVAVENNEIGPEYVTREKNQFKYWPSYSGPVILTYYAEPEPGKYFADQTENNGGLPEIFDIVAEFVFYRAVAEGWRFVREPSKFQQYADLWASGMKDTQRQYDNTDFVGSTMQVGNPYL